MTEFIDRDRYHKQRPEPETRDKRQRPETETRDMERRQEPETGTSHKDQGPRNNTESIYGDRSIYQEPKVKTRYQRQVREKRP